MLSYVYCEKDHDKFNLINFYLEHEGNIYYLFTQHYSNTAYDRFKNRKTLKEALKFQKGIQLRSFNDKLPKYIKYIEDTENILVLDKSIKKDTAKSIKQYHKFSPIIE